MRGLLAVACLLLAPAASLAQDVAKDLAPPFRQFLEEVALLITPEETKAFLALEKDYQREAFIREFWKARDPYPETVRNEFETEWRRRLEERKARYPDKADDRGRIYMLKGEPASIYATDCGLFLLPLEIWTYPQGRGRFTFLFRRPAASGPFRLWRPSEGWAVLLPAFRENDDGLGDEDRFIQLVNRRCLGNAPLIRRAIYDVKFEDQGAEFEIAQSQPENKGDNEWLASFRSVSTDVDPDQPTLPARFDGLEMELGRGQRVRLRALLSIASTDATASEVAGSPSYEFLVTGELIISEGGEELLDSFRVRFDLPKGDGAPSGVLPLTVEREVRPGPYKLVLKIEELATKKVVRFERAIEVTPGAEGSSAAAADATSRKGDTAGLPTAAPAVPIRLLAPAGDLQSGSVRIDAEIGDPRITKVTFQLEDKPILTKARPPYSVELNLGPLPQSRTVRALGYDATGTLIGSDELALNPGGQRFAVRLLEPRPGQYPGGRRSAEAEIKVPDGETIDRLELFVDDRRVATLYQPPWIQPVDLPTGGAIVSVRALAYLADGRSAEDLVVLNAPGDVGRVEVRLVELPVEVHDEAGHAVDDLSAADFAVTEEGTPQTLLRCDRVENLPIRAALLLDTSASMQDALGQVQQAAGGFLRSALRSGDRAALLRFSEKPVVEVPFTPDIEKLVRGLAGLSAERSTALFDSVVFALDYMKGLAGARALVLLTDGGDKSSRFDFDQTLEAARRSGVVIYAIGLAMPRTELAARHNLERLAESTGGLALFPDSAAELSDLYRAIDRDLRSRWLLTYQSTQSTSDGKFRRVEVTTKRPGLEIKAPAGYAP